VPISPHPPARLASRQPSQSKSRKAWNLTPRSADSRRVSRSRFSLELPACSGLEASTAPKRHNNPHTPLAVLLRHSFKRFCSSSNMFKRSFASKDRVGKISKPAKRSFNEKKQKMLEKMDSPMDERYHDRRRRQQDEKLTSPSLVSRRLSPAQSSL
jgi:hypothetical protein